MLTLKFSSLMTYNVQKRHSMKLLSEELLLLIQIQVCVTLTLYSYNCTYNGYC